MSTLSLLTHAGMPPLLLPELPLLPDPLLLPELLPEVPELLPELPPLPLSTPLLLPLEPLPLPELPPPLLPPLELPPFEPPELDPEPELDPFGAGSTLPWPP